MSESEQEKRALWKRAIAAVPIGLILFYRKCISPLFPPTCRFRPTCSSYALKAFKTYNPFYASYLAVWRILRCNPFNPGGYDPVPGTEPEDDEATSDPQSDVSSP